MAADYRSCPSCGAHVPADADRCDLCGTSVERSATEEQASGEVEGSSSEERQSVFCNQCGWENPPGARYCSQCGEELQDLEDPPPPGTRPVAADLPTSTERKERESASSPPEGDSEQSAMGRQVALVVGGALLLVIGFFLITQWSTRYEGGADPEEPPAAQAPTGAEGLSGGGNGPSGEQMPGSSSGAGEGQLADLQDLVAQSGRELNGRVGRRVDSLRTLIDGAPAEEKQQYRAELVNLLIGAGYPGRAAVHQKDVAEATGAVDDQRRAADLLYQWMQQLQEEGQRQEVYEVARHAAQSYAVVAEERPDDLDARTRMGEAYLLTNEPMQGIEAINAVLDADSTFVPARFQKALALLQINRFDQALQEFEKVLRDAEEESPFYRQAERAIEVIREQREASEQRSSPGS